ncbi:MAG: hypothetical protein ACRCZI_15690, partial [Cetobacterium sp.]
MKTMDFALPHDPFTPLDPTSRPTPRTVCILRKELYANLCEVTSDLGGGNHGHLGMVMPAAEYALLSNGVAYIHPEQPDLPNYGGTAAVIANDQLLYQEEKQVYQEYRAISNHTKAMLVQCIPPTFIRPLLDPRLGTANTTPKAIMDHLLATYGEIQDSDLKENLEELHSAWNPDTPIEEVFSRGTFCRDIAVEGEDPITDASYTRALVTVFEKSGVMEKAIEDWIKKPRADRTVDNCELHFVKANHYRLIKASKETKDVLAANG